MERGEHSGSRLVWLPLDRRKRQSARAWDGNADGEPPDRQPHSTSRSRTGGLGVDVLARPEGHGPPASGAGYDGRSPRYAKPGVRWFELDHPDTQADKRARLRRLGIGACEITFAPVDFALDDVAALLGQLGHDPSRTTLFTCEGVAAYLSPEVLSSLLTAIRRRAAPNSKLAIELPLEPQSVSETFRRALLNAAVTSMGEPLLSVIDGQKLDAFLAAKGWSVERAADPAGVDIDESQSSFAFIVATPAA
jgi:hypothetical protein